MEEDATENREITRDLGITGRRGTANRPLALVFLSRVPLSQETAINERMRTFTLDHRLFSSAPPMI